MRALATAYRTSRLRRWTLVKTPRPHLHGKEKKYNILSRPWTARPRAPCYLWLWYTTAEASSIVTSQYSWHSKEILLEGDHLPIPWENWSSRSLSRALMESPWDTTWRATAEDLNLRRTMSRRPNVEKAYILHNTFGKKIGIGTSDRLATTSSTTATTTTRRWATFAETLPFHSFANTRFIISRARVYSEIILLE